MAGKVKIRTVSKLSLIMTIVLTVICVGISTYGLQKYAVLKNSFQEYVSCESAILQFIKGSDTLTEQARLAAATGDITYIDNYFKEANVDQNREKALEEIASHKGNEDAVKLLKKSLQNSKKLMETEYYVMCLVEEANGINQDNWAQELKNVEISEDDEGLSVVEKLARAQYLMSNSDYELAKEKIIEGTNEALQTLSNQIGNKQNKSAIIFLDAFKKILFCIGCFTLFLFAIYYILRHWIVTPLVKYNESIKQSKIFPICGAYELQLLAKTYNEVFLENEEREKLMKHQVEHDSLTGVLNRGAFDQILGLLEKDKRNFALILVDVDNFKGVNDNYGHAMGDSILKRVSKLLKDGFRSIDHVCRIGGDEFAVIMMDVTSDLGYTIENKIGEINNQLATHEENVPPVSLSVGAAFMDRENPKESMFKDADRALYYVKEHGRNGCRIYSIEDATIDEG